MVAWADLYTFCPSPTLFKYINKTLSSDKFVFYQFPTLKSILAFPTQFVHDYRYYLQHTFSTPWIGLCGKKYLQLAKQDVITFKNHIILAELGRPEGPPSGAPYPYTKLKQTHELIFS